ncbi:MAG: nitroreductase family deazaflavin-dependent oxidoreductase [Ktedonobacterales bacterium]|nr:nitroreductase family deazaflavin-dependent oxidoreductase [Ktedonobacterales bacterium]
MRNVQLTDRPFPRSTARIQGLVTGFHVWLYHATGGRIGHYLPGKIPTLLLTTVGRRSGKRYTTPLTYVRDGADLVLIASNGGTATHPSWWLNLQAQPETTVQVGAKTLRVRAVLAPPDQRTRLWNMAVAVYSGYTGYQQRTAREIPVVVLHPLGAD